MGQGLKRHAHFEDYIRLYYKEAIRQMQRHSIPASITMAQGLVETGAGKSTLATEHNNHFGIKCHSDWKGGRAYKTDDAPNECFRSYTRWQDSYEDHSLFLKGRRYANLFNLNREDYRGWAVGLQRAGYATNKGYANKLIQVIETYELYALDSEELPLWLGSGKASTSTAKASSSRNKASSKPSSTSKASKPMRSIYKSYGLYYVLAERGDNLERIAEEMGLSLRKLASYNDAPEDMRLRSGDVIYLERKHRRATDKYTTHIVGIGDSMHSISQRYGIRLESLYELNDKDEDYSPEEGDILRLR